MVSQAQARQRVRRPALPLPKSVKQHQASSSNPPALVSQQASQQAPSSSDILALGDQRLLSDFGPGTPPHQSSTMADGSFPPSEISHTSSWEVALLHLFTREQYIGFFLSSLGSSSSLISLAKHCVLDAKLRKVGSVLSHGSVYAFNGIHLSYLP